MDTQEVKMKSVFLFILCSFVLAGISFSQSLAHKGFVGTFGGGLSFPMSESTFKDNYDYGYNISITGGYKLNKMYMVRGGISFNRFPYSEVDNRTGSFRTVVLNTEFLLGAFNIRQKYHPYAIAGTGLYFLNSKLKDSGLESIATENDIGFSVGGGIIIDLSRNFGLFAEVEYNHFLSNWSAKGYMTTKAGISLSQ